VEVISGPALVSKWIGDTEAAIRTVFARAKAMAPAIILFDELDCIAPARGQADHQHDISMVSQLLVLLDGLEGRGQVFMLGTTNRPEDIDPALRRPGRFDQTVTLGLPDLAGRRATFHHYLKPLTLTRGLSPKDLAADLAARTQGVSGADIQFICQQAVCLCVKQGLASGTSPDKLALSVDHFHRAAQAQRGATHSVASPLHGSNCKCI
jgi:SpoVK/Ycf46/Vps4 family AAA+-type ATPase